MYSVSWSSQEDFLSVERPVDLSEAAVSVALGFDSGDGLDQFLEHIAFSFLLLCITFYSVIILPINRNVNTFSLFYLYFFCCFWFWVKKIAPARTDAYSSK